MSLNLEFVEVLLGHRLINAWRISYEFQGQIDRKVGALELEFDKGYLNLSGAGDGEKLSLSNEPWYDPFNKPLSGENKDYVKRYGKHVKVSADLSLYKGQTLTKFCLINNQFETIAGLKLVFENASIIFVVESDESYIMTEEDKRLNEWGFEILEATHQHVV